MDLQVFIFTWNTQSICYGDDPKADFVNLLAEEIINSEREHDLVVFGLQEDAIRDSQLFADNSLIANSISTKYTLLKLVSLSGWGVTTYKALKNEWEYRPRGLRLAVFKRRDLDLEINSIDTKELVCPGLHALITAGKGGVAVNLHTNFGMITFLNMHLPFSGQSIIQDKISKRHPAIIWQAKCMRLLYETVMCEYNPDYLFILGDLNFRVQIRNETGAGEIAQKIFDNPEYIKELICEADELSLLFSYSKLAKYPLVPLLNEGVNNTGPKFLPTCKLKKGRKTTLHCFRLGKYDHRTPSWCDRILFYQSPIAMGTVNCLLYDRWDYSDINFSDHAAVIGIYNLH